MVDGKKETKNQADSHDGVYEELVNEHDIGTGEQHDLSPPLI
jgi:hypothetical protein